MRNLLRRPVFIVPAVLLLVVALLLGFPLEFLFHLAIGWVLYLARVVPSISVDWGGLVTAVLCLAVLTVGVQRFCQWFFARAQRALAPDAQPARRWKPNWTLCFLGVVILMFVAGIAAVGLTHQTAWLITSPERMTEGGIRDVANQMQSQNNLKQIALALHNYDARHTRFPPGGTFDAHGRMLHGWQTRLLPYLEQDGLYRRLNLTIPWNHPDNAPHFRSLLREYQHPNIKEQYDATGFALSHYAANVRVLGGDVPFNLRHITDAAANTILAGEAAGNYKPWGHSTNWRDPALGLNHSSDGFGGPSRRQVTTFVFADGSIRTLRNNISPEVLKALSTPNGGEKIPDDLD